MVQLSSSFVTSYDPYLWEVWRCAHANAHVGHDLFHKSKAITLLHCLSDQAPPQLCRMFTTILVPGSPAKNMAGPITASHSVARVRELDSVGHCDSATNGHCLPSVLERSTTGLPFLEFIAPRHLSSIVRRPSAAHMHRIVARPDCPTPLLSRY